MFLRLMFLSLITAASAVLPGHGRLSPIIGPGDVNAARIQTYIVFVQKPRAAELLSDEDVESWHASFLPNTTLDTGEPRLVYSYREAISGFAAKLSRDEVEAMEAVDGFLSAVPDEPAEPRTTHTPAFLHLEVDMLDTRTLWPDSSWGAGITIGVIDSGVHPTHASFGDAGVPQPPATPERACEFSNFACNRKIIKAKAFGSKHADDEEGHGTHVAGIAAGNFVTDAHVLGSARGTASGMAPRAHLAIYRADTTADVVGAVDEAMRDGVDIISMSMTFSSQDLRRNPVMAAAFSAVARGILFCASAGNGGPWNGTVENQAPWMMTVGAGTTDRRVTVILRLGNGTELMGESGYQPEGYVPVQLPMVYLDREPGTNGLEGRTRESVLHHLFDNTTVVFHGKKFGENDPKYLLEVGKYVQENGGAGMGTLLPGFVTSSLAHVLPASDIYYGDQPILNEYYLGAKAAGQIPTAAFVFNGTDFHGYPAPQVSYFSGRGPSSANGGILKPDIIAPGQSILAAYPFPVGPDATTARTTDSGFDFLSGTSMSTPHVSGVAALIKKVHPRWSSAIRSALMTTAQRTDSGGQSGILDAFDHSKAGIFAMGAGHLSPEDARDPGLVYELREPDYLSYLCGLGYSDRDVSMFKSNTTCPPGFGIDAEQLNYPSINVTVGKDSTKTIQRVLTNVAGSGSTYQFQIEGIKGVNVRVSPVTLEFNKPGDTVGFNVTFSTVGQPASKKATSEGLLTATDRKHFVATPVVVTFT